jgi:hypothetical protein
LEFYSSHFCDSSHGNFEGANYWLGFANLKLFKIRRRYPSVNVDLRIKSGLYQSIGKYGLFSFNGLLDIAFARGSEKWRQDLERLIQKFIVIEHGRELARCAGVASAVIDAFFPWCLPGQLERWLTKDGQVRY